MNPEHSTKIANHASQLFGLVLSGGKSSRMGKDKGLVNYHGTPQREYLYFLLKKVCDSVFLSIRQEQLPETPTSFKTVVDQDKYNGPFNGIMSAFDAHPNVGWLVIACDLPFMDLPSLQQLIGKRNPEKSATAFKNPDTGNPEPLCCIWEPNGLEEAMSFLKDSDYPSPKKFLMDAEILLVQPKNEQALFNANSLSDYDFVKSKLKEQERG